MGERKVIMLSHRINQYGMTLVEGAALRVLPREADRIAFQDDRTKRQRFREPVIHSALTVAHFAALFEELRNFRVDVETIRRASEAVSNFSQSFPRQTGIDLILWLVPAMRIGRPVFRQLAKVRDLF